MPKQVIKKGVEAGIGFRRKFGNYYSCDTCQHLCGEIVVVSFNKDTR